MEGGCRCKIHHCWRHEVPESFEGMDLGGHAPHLKHGRLCFTVWWLIQVWVGVACLIFCVSLALFWASRSILFQCPMVCSTSTLQITLKNLTFTTLRLSLGQPYVPTSAYRATAADYDNTTGHQREGGEHK